MPALKKLPPESLRAILEADGFKLRYEDEFNWWLSRGLTDIPLNVPKEVGEDGCVSFLVMESVLFDAAIDHKKYFLLYTAVFGDKKGPANGS